MDFSVIFQLRTKKFWWMDVIFYFVISLFIATILCYVIFLVKNSMQRKDIEKEILALQTVGTPQQKQYEQEVITYQRKINDFSGLLKSHEFASNVFAFMQQQTMPNVWFKQFGLDAKNDTVRVSGEADSMDTFSRQVAVLEKSKYVKSVGTLNPSLGESARVQFDLGLSLDQGIFSYLAIASPILQTNAPATGTQGPQEEEIPATPAEEPIEPGESNAAAGPATGTGAVTGIISSEKLITAFHLLLNPEVAGVVDQTGYNITINVPFGTDVKNLTPAIIFSPGATVTPASNVSQNFTNPVVYRVVAQDGSVQTYTVKVIIDEPAQVKEIPSKSGSVAMIIVLLVGIVAVAAGIFLFFWRRNRIKKTKL